jgi:hypothetical protein
MLRASTRARWASTATTARKTPQLPWGLTRRFERRLPLAEVSRAAPLTPLGLLNRPTWQPNDDAQALRSYVDALASPRDAHIVAVICGATMLDDGGITAEAAAVSGGPVGPPPPAAAGGAAAPSSSSSGYSVESRTVGPVSRRGRRRGSIVAGTFPPATAASHPAAAAAEAAAAAAASSTSTAATAADADAADGSGGDGAAPLPRSVQLFLDGAREVFLTLFARGLPGVHEHARAVREGGLARASSGNGGVAAATPTVANADTWLPPEARELLHGTIIEALAAARKHAQEAAAEAHAANSTTATTAAATGTSTPSPAAAVAVPAVAVTEVRDVKIVDAHAVWDGTLMPDDLGDGVVQARERGHSVALVTDTSRMNAIERLLTATAHFYQLHPARAVVAQLTVAFTCVESHDGVRVGAATGAAAAPAAAATVVAPSTPEEKLTVHTLTFESAVEDDEASPPLLGRLMTALPIVRYLRTPVLRPAYGWRIVDIDGHFSPVGGSGVPGALGVTVPRSGGLTFSDLLPRGLKLATQRAHDEVEEITGRVRAEAPLFEAVAVEADALAEAVDATADALRRAGPGGAAALGAPPGAPGDDAGDAGALFSGDKDAARAPGEMLAESARLLRFVARAARVMGSTSRPPWVARVQAEAEWEAAVDAGGSWRVPLPAPSAAAASPSATAAADGDSSSDDEAQAGDGSGEKAAAAAAAAAPATPPTPSPAVATAAAVPPPTGDLTDDTAYQSVPAASVVPRFAAADDSGRTVAWLTRRMRYAFEGGGAAGSGGAMSTSDRLALQTYTLMRKRMESFGGERVAADADYELAWKLARNLAARGVFALLTHRLKPLAEAHVAAGRPEAAVYAERAELLSGLPKELVAASDRLESPQAAAAMGAVREAMGRVQAEATGGGGKGAAGDDDDGAGEEEEDEEVAAALAGDCSRGVSDYRPTGRRPPSSGGSTSGWYRSLYAWADRSHGMLEGLQRLAGDMASAGLLQQAPPPRGGAGGGGGAASSDGAAPSPTADYAVGRRAARARAAAARQAREQEEQQQRPQAQPTEGKGSS